MPAMAAPMVTAAVLAYFSQLVEIVERNTELRKTSRGIFWQIAKTALFVIIGGLLLGPLGAMIGGIVGSVVAYCTSGDYNALYTTMRQMSDEEKARVVDNVRNMVGSSTLSDLHHFVTTSGNVQLLLSAIQAGIGATASRAQQPPPAYDDSSKYYSPTS